MYPHWGKPTTCRGHEKNLYSGAFVHFISWIPSSFGKEKSCVSWKRGNGGPPHCLLGFSAFLDWSGASERRNLDKIGGDNKITSKGTLISIQLRIVDHFVSTRPSNDSNERLSYNRYYIMSGKGFFIDLQSSMLLLFLKSIYSTKTKHKLERTRWQKFESNTVIHLHLHQAPLHTQGQGNGGSIHCLYCKGEDKKVLEIVERGRRRRRKKGGESWNRGFQGDRRQLPLLPRQQELFLCLLSFFSLFLLCVFFLLTNCVYYY